MFRDSLSGIRVVDLTQVVSGALTTMMLADFGAEVIKVEPIGGETYRRFGKPLTGPGGETNLNFMRFSRGKKSIELNLKADEGRDILRGLIAEADILVENFRPGVLGRLGFPPEVLREINPRLVYTTISGFGHDDLLPSPFRDRPAYAIIAESMAGITHLAGDGEGPPVWLGFAMSDIYAGTLAFSGTLVALRERDQTGVGGRVDISMYDAALLMNDLAMVSELLTGVTMGSGQYSLQSPWGPFEAKDGYVTVAVLNANEWRALCAVVGRPDMAEDPELATGQHRSQKHETHIRPVVEAWMASRTKEQAVEELLAGGVPAAPVQTSRDVASCPHVAAREMLMPAWSNELGEITSLGNPIKMGDPMAKGTPRIPSLGEHTAEILRDLLGVDPGAIAELAADGAIGPVTELSSVT